MSRELPTEILHGIVFNLDGPLAPYASVSRSFQDLIEQATFAEIKTSSANDEVKLFESVFSSLRRRRLLRTLHFKVELPDISEKHFKKFQSRREAAGNNLVYTNAVHALFRRLAPWVEVPDVETPCFPLNITSVSPKDEKSPHSSDNHNRPAWEVRNDYKYIEFNQAFELPPVACVNVFSPEGRRLDPSTLAAISRALPNLKLLDWWFYTAPSRLHALWLGLRESMASAVLDLAKLTALEDLHLYFEDSDPASHDWEPMSVVDSAGNDRLSVSLSHLSKLPRLRNLKIDGLHTLSPALFDLHDEKNSWQSLEYLELQVSAIAPDGRWYFTGDRNLAEQDEQEDYERDPDAPEAALDSEDSDASDFLPEFKWAKLDGQVSGFNFRRHPDPDVFDPFVMAMASAAVRMPALKQCMCDFTQARAATITPGQARPGFCATASNLERGSWTIILEREDSDADDNWNPPEEMVQKLEASNICISVSRGQSIIFSSSSRSSPFISEHNAFSQYHWTHRQVDFVIFVSIHRIRTLDIIQH